MGFELGIEGGTVITHDGRRRANVYVAGGRIAAVSAARERARQIVDAGGLMVMPGMVDVHVHFMDPSATDREDFPAGSSAAARAGVTTVVEHSHSGPVRSAQELREKAAYLAGRSHVDFGLAAHAWPDRLAEVADVWDAGATFVKAFTCTTHGVPGFDAACLAELMAIVGELGAICLVHCEDGSLTAAAEARLRAEGRQDGAVIPLWRSREAELAAVSLTALLARGSGARVVIAHASHTGVLEVAGGNRDASSRLYVESCPQYLTLLEHEVVEEGALRKFTPPARARSGADLDRMWAALGAGEIDYISTDHAPSTREQKSEGSIWDVHFGVPGIDTTLSVLLDGAARGLVSYERVVEAYSRTPARLYGLHAKGRIEPGSDADLVLIDPGAKWTVSDRDVLSKAGWSPLSGRVLQGRAVATYLRGIRVAGEGTLTAGPGTGRFVPGPGVKAW
ncbi:MAG: dihydroorotase [Candidatus Dormibacteraceae bacterium]